MAAVGGDKPIFGIVDPQSVGQVADGTKQALVCPRERCQLPFDVVIYSSLAGSNLINSGSNNPTAMKRTR